MTTLRAGWVITGRDLAHRVRQPWTPIFGLLFSVMLLLIFGYLFGGAIEVPGGGGYRTPAAPLITRLRGGCAGRAGAAHGYDRGVRLTDFWARLEQAFGATYARSLAADHAFSGLGGRTIDEAIAQGIDTATVWRAVVATYPDRVPSRLH